jgi:hypothetical protein
VKQGACQAVSNSRIVAAIASGSPARPRYRSARFRPGTAELQGPAHDVFLTLTGQPAKRQHEPVNERSNDQNLWMALGLVT